MKSRSILYGLSALALGSAVISGSAMLATAATPSQTADARRAAGEAREAREDLADGKADRAVRHAEAAVQYDPRNPEYRALLGQSYLMAGRFVSAGQALTDALSLDPANGRVALNLALAEIAQGQWAEARTTLEAHSATIPDGDRGLAFALAGDPVTAVEILTPAARGPEADAKTRQNLALSLALAGRWQEAKAIAAVDVPPDQLDQRIMDWASFARPTNAYDQVATLLGVRAIEDAGQPQQLALAQSMTQVAAVSQTVDPIDAYMPRVPEQAVEIAQDLGVSPEILGRDEQVLASQPSSGGQRVVFGPREEIVQALPSSPRRDVALAAAQQPASAPAPARQTTAVAMPARASGNYYVQLGAFRNAGAARTAWRQASGRYSVLGGAEPSGMQVSNRRGSFYRLSVGGFARAEAEAMCRQIKSSGGACFVRAHAGDQVASWVRSDTQVASR